MERRVDGETEEVCPAFWIACSPEGDVVYWSRARLFSVCQPTAARPRGWTG